MRWKRQWERINNLQTTRALIFPIYRVTTPKSLRSFLFVRVYSHLLQLPQLSPFLKTWIETCLHFFFYAGYSILFRTWPFLTYSRGFREDWPANRGPRPVDPEGASRGEERRRKRQRSRRFRRCYRSAGRFVTLAYRVAASTHLDERADTSLPKIEPRGPTFPDLS